MAFSATADSNSPVSTGGNITKFTGSWSQTAAGADGSLVVAGGTLVGYQFLNLDGTGPAEANVFVTTSATGGLITLTVKAHDAVTTGRYWVETK